jgi:hypothetical protein
MMVWSKGNFFEKNKKRGKEIIMESMPGERKVDISADDG